jgi:electron transfer flavoprotein-quinone oxidoreductase
MDLAIESGRLAAKTVIQAKEAGDFSRSGLAAYEGLLKDSFVFKDLETFKEAPEFLETPGLYGEYPALIADIFSAMFKVDGTPARPVSKKVMPLVKKAGLLNLAKVAWKGRKL